MKIFYFVLRICLIINIKQNYRVSLKTVHFCALYYLASFEFRIYFSIALFSELGPGIDQSRSLNWVYLNLLPKYLIMRKMISLNGFNHL